MPRKDEAFEKRKMDARRLLKKIQEEGLNPVKVKHQEKFPDVYIYNSEDDEWVYIEELNPQSANGREMVVARAAGLAGSLAYDAIMDSAREPTVAVCRSAREAGHAVAAEKWAQRP